MKVVLKVLLYILLGLLALAFIPVVFMIFLFGGAILKGLVFLFVLGIVIYEIWGGLTGSSKSLFDFTDDD